MSGQDPNGDWDDTFNLVSYQHDKACSFDVSVTASYSGCYYADLSNNSNWQCVTGWASMQYGPSGTFGGTYVTNPDYIIAGTKSISLLTYPKDILRFKATSKQSRVLPFLRRSLFVKEVITNNENNTVILKNIKGTISQAGNKKHGSSFQIVVWYADSPNDTTLTPKKILWEARAESGLEDVKLFGGFDRKEIQMNTYKDSVESILTITEKVIQLPKNIDMRRVVVRVRSAESGVEGADPYKPMIPMSFIQNIYPNPISDNFTLLFGLPTPQEYVVKLTSSDLQFTQDIVVPKGTIEIKISTGSMPEGVFYLLLNNNAFIDRRKLLKTRK